MAVSQARIRRVPNPGALRIRIEGEFGLLHSFGHVSRELALSLADRPEIALDLLMVGPCDFRFENDPKARVLIPLFSSLDGEVDFHVRHHWPPNFVPPRSGRWVLAQPWEYGSLPETWVNAFREAVDDVWCFSRYVKDCYVRAGFPNDRTPIIPHGVDPDMFRPDVEPLQLPTGRAFRFLYVGGTLHRKGADLLLEAYLRAFSSRDDVALVVKDMGTNTFYKNQTLGERFLEISKDPTRPEVLYMHKLPEFIGP